MYRFSSAPPPWRKRIKGNFARPSHVDGTYRRYGISRPASAKK
jgi:hypothetical protein